MPNVQKVSATCMYIPIPTELPFCMPPLMVGQAVDLCVSLGLPVIVEDSWGGDIATAAILQLAATTPDRFRLQ